MVHLTPTLSGFENLNHASLIQNWLLSRLCAYSVHHLNFAEERK